MRGIVRAWMPATALLAAVLSPSRALAIDPVFLDSFETGDSCAWTPGPSTCPGFRIETPPVTVLGGEEATWCYYFHTPNSAAMGIRKWKSTMTPGTHHMIAYTTYDAGWNPADRQPAGTLTQSPCGFGSGTGNAAWVFAAHDPAAELAMPGDDGSGTPLAVEIPAGQPGFIYMRAFNSGTDPITASVQLEAEALPPATPYTETATYHAINTTLSIPPGSVGFPAAKTCPTPPGVEFWWLSTRTHRFATQAKVRDGNSDLVVSTDWEHPSALVLAAPNFHAFSSGLTYECTYNNPTGASIVAGESESTNETCIGVGYFFPATRPMLCINNIGPL